MYSQICAYMNSKFWMDQEGVYQGYNIKHTHTQYKFANIIVSLIKHPLIHNIANKGSSN
jgi:hypothetical protein